MRITEFVHEYEKASKNMRTEELEEDFRYKQGTSFQIVQNCGLLQLASSVYTRTMFKRFELEITFTLGVTHQDVNSDGVSFTYEVIEEVVGRFMLSILTPQIMLSRATVKCLKHWGYYVNMLYKYLL